MLTCLIVEDNPVNWMIMQNQLKKLGLRADICMDGHEALEYCQKQRIPHLILLDGYMPGMDGITFLKALRAMPGGAAPFVLFCSSSLDRVDVAEALRCGADCHFPKPISREQMLLALEQARIRAGIAADALQSATLAQPAPKN